MIKSHDDVISDSPVILRAKTNTLCQCSPYLSGDALEVSKQEVDINFDQTTILVGAPEPLTRDWEVVLDCRRP